MDVEDFIRDIGADKLRRLKETSSTSKTAQEIDAKERADDLTKLKRAWLAERMAPDVLPYQTELLGRMSERITQQMEFIEERSLTVVDEPDVKIHLLVVESELERIKFLMRGYLRARLAKFDKYAIHILKSIDQQDGDDDHHLDRNYARNLSRSELKYIARQVTILSRLHGVQFLDSFPQGLEVIDDGMGSRPVVQKPDFDKTVCIYVDETIPTPILAGTDELDMEKGNVYAIRYSAIEPFVRDGSVRLV